jgi:gliding motility-associated-like protein
MESNSVSVVVNSIPAIPTAENSGAVCDGGDITLFTPPVAGATYQWSGPGGYTSAAQSPILNDVTAAMNGNAYSVIVTVNGCSSLASSPTNITVYAIPSTPTVASNSPVCENTTLTLACTTVYPAGATYQWFGPAAFTSNLQNPVISTATMAQNGSYLLYVTINGCTSLAGTVEVAVNAQPTTPVITSNMASGMVCESNNITLSSSIATGISATYTWYYDVDGFGAAPSVALGSTTNGLYEITGITTTQEGYYSVVVNVEGCNSLVSAYYFVDVTATLATPNISSNAPICEGTTLQLNSNTVADSYAWSGPDGFTSNVQNPTVVTNSTSFNAGVYNLITTINGCNSNAASTTVVINSIPSSPLLTSNSPVCAGLPLTLTAAGTYPAGTTYVWHLPSGATQTTTTNTLNVPAPAPAGLYTVDALTSAGCISAINTNDFNGDGYPDNQTITVTDFVPGDAAYAGNNFSVCAGADATTLSASASSGAGVWSFAAGSPTCTIVNPEFNNTILDNMQAGSTYSLVWSSTNGACGVYDSDTVQVSVYANTVAANDTFYTYENEQNTYYTILGNDALAANATVSIVTLNPHGTITVNADNTINYTAPDGWTGIDSIAYNVCLVDCPTMCSTAWIIVEVLPRVPDCELPNVITPNNDGANDLFEINCFDNYPNGKMEIYNRWGNLVFAENPYTNTWAGTLETINGSELPDGTYFYVWTNMDDNAILAKGFITIIR